MSRGRRPSIGRVAIALLLLLLAEDPRQLGVEAGCYVERNLTGPAGDYDLMHCFNPRNFTFELSHLPVNTTQMVHIRFDDGSVPEISDDAFQNLTNKLIGITITNCHLSKIGDNAFKGLKTLKILELTKNDFTEVKESWFEDLDQLIILNLSDNQIEKLDEKLIEKVPELRELDLSGNKLTKLDVNNLKGKLSKLKMIGLKGNPYEWKTAHQVLRYLKDNQAIAKNATELKQDPNASLKVVESCMTEIKSEDESAIGTCVADKSKNDTPSITSTTSQPTTTTLKS